MKHLKAFTILAGFILSLTTFSTAQEIWDSQPLNFEKKNYADWTKAENQDRITNNVWITRQNSRPIFNIAKNAREDSPLNTRWAIGSIADGVQNLRFDYWAKALGENPPSYVDSNLVLHLVKENIYIDIKFVSWTQGGNGGGFSYERSTGNLTDSLWTGTKITFSKANNADWTQQANQDRITDDTWLTRADSKGIFNIKMETEYVNDFGAQTSAISSPEGTSWALGQISDGVENLKFGSWVATVRSAPPAFLDTNMVLFLIADSIYIDIKFTSWAQNAGGGGFSYERSTGTASQTLWTGPKMTFSKDDNVDWKLSANQDRITDNVWITRADSMGIFNVKTEESFMKGFDIPEGTMWAYGKTADGIANLQFDYFLNLVEEQPPSVIGKDLVLHLVEDDIYIDLKFTSWTSGEQAGGGGFAYTRATAPSVSVPILSGSLASLYPNPASNYIRVEGGSSTLKLFNHQGQLVMISDLGVSDRIDVSSIAEGLYLYQLVGDEEVTYGRIIISR